MPNPRTLLVLLTALPLATLGCLPCRDGYVLQEDGSCLRTIFVEGQRDTAANQAEATEHVMVPVEIEVQPGTLALDPYVSALLEVWSSHDVRPEGPDREGGRPLSSGPLPLAELAAGDPVVQETMVGVGGVRPTEIYIFVALSDPAREVLTIRAQQEPYVMDEDGSDTPMLVILDEDQAVGG